MLRAVTPMDANTSLWSVSEAMDKLPEEQRLALELKHLHGLQVAAIAQQLGRTKPAVVGLLYRGLKKLRELLHEEGE